jgi:hypothetical protein
MKYLSKWQPLDNEDEHTALLFGFLRHAPVEYALNPWLTSILEREVKADPLGQTAFWPRLRSIVPGSFLTEPELVFQAYDGLPLSVVIEVKPGHDMLYLDQVRREVVDVANARGARRIACVMVGADLTPPMDLAEWQKEIEATLGFTDGLAAVKVELVYASFASLGQAAGGCAKAKPEWRAYAEDVIAQLQRKGLLRYDGAPVLDDLEGLTIPNAVEAFNRSIKAARAFFLELHADGRFRDLDLAPLRKEHAMFRNGGSETLKQPVVSFETTVAMTLYKRKNWDPQRWIFVCFDLLGETRTHADLCVGLAQVSDTMTYGFAKAERRDSLANFDLQEAESDFFEERFAEPGSQWRFARRPWLAGSPAKDIDWTIDRLRDAGRIWDEVTTRTLGVTSSGFDGFSTDTLRVWLKWWSKPRRYPEGSDDADRDPAAEVAKLEAEIKAREGSGAP